MHALSACARAVYSNFSEIYRSNEPSYPDRLAQTSERGAAERLVKGQFLRLRFRFSFPPVPMQGYHHGPSLPSPRGIRRDHLPVLSTSASRGYVVAPVAVVRSSWAPFAPSVSSDARSLLPFAFAAPDPVDGRPYPGYVSERI